ncbi:MAG: ABC transporter ATP-binding protein [Planctomycetes bacterium]|nr:ABC transporter ATP-binding protein [Planctomycetota bacterium]
MSLVLENVRKSYAEPGGGRLTVLDIERFELKPAEQVVLVGASGGGKTTLLNVISGITSPDEGSVTVDNVNLTKLHEASRDRFRAERIGFVFQTFNLLPAFTALENVLLGMSFSRENSLLPAFTALKNVFLGMSFPRRKSLLPTLTALKNELIESFFRKKTDRKRAAELLNRVGLGNRLKHRPGQLSVGEQQRVAVARSLANSPSLLLADEPTANVDVANQDLILNLIRETCAEHQVALLMVTHAPEVASLFDRVEKLSDFNTATGTA